jgi:hypothetical protein
MKNLTSLKCFLLCVVLTLCWQSLQASEVYAWGYFGHRLIARVAEQYLSPQIEHEVRKLLGPRTLADVSDDPDGWRSKRPETGPWHFVNIPLQASTYDAERDCPNGDCIIAAIVRFQKVLADRNQSRSARTEALIFLVHLVGDLHQPLHCADNNDRGGNDVNVTFFGQSGPEYDLHAVWDEHLLRHTRMRERVYVRKLLALLDPRSLTHLQEGSVTDWALETHQVAVAYAYNLSPYRQLGSTYYRENLPVLDNQLAKAGVRLARILNDALQSD